ncbi:phosphate ABC transporter permease PstA [Halobaculum marinum]|uniref:Phosphate transport system permease protein PstA n=1 Tax=Halobaculum marinum TaxID=3031996 RepID=A0ABD5X0M8_9EURY|nr:phosphate ABC transporter permease PstA [Halobaculum sp. DT55]
MAAETNTRNALVRDDASGTGIVAVGAVALAAVLFAASMAVLFQVVDLTTPVAGVSLATILGGGLVLLGGATVSFGVGSRLELVETEPQATAGMLAGVVFAGIWFVVAGLVASQTLGLGTFGWVATSVVVGVGVFAVTVGTREDIGSTVPAGLLAVAAGLVFLTGLIGPEWVWDLGFEQKASFTGGFTIPTVTLFCALVAGWASAKAYGGFGARGRHTGAYTLVYLNAGSIVGVLFILVAFTVFKGTSGVVNGFALGPGVGPESTIVLFGQSISWEWPFYLPFVMNGVGLTNDFNGVLPAIVGTIWLVVGAVVFAVPLGVGAAVFLTEYAERGRFTQVVEVATNGLWSTPSIVFGLFGFAFLIPRFGNGKSLLAGMLTLGFMLLPLVVITSREAMLSVPDEYRDASAALGVTKWQTIRSVVLPAALPGVVTGIILGVGRIAGETAPILLTMAGGVFVPGSQTPDVIGGFEFTSSPPFVDNPVLLDAASALPYQLYALITAGVGASGNVANPDEFKWATALVLLIVVLSFYAIGIAARYYFRRELNQ